MCLSLQLVRWRAIRLPVLIFKQTVLAPHRPLDYSDGLEATLDTAVVYRLVN